MGWLAELLGVPEEGESVPACRSCGEPVDVAGLICIRRCETCMVASVDQVADDGAPAA
jgi:hypothetical protein